MFLQKKKGDLTGRSRSALVPCTVQLVCAGELLYFSGCVACVH